MVSLILLNTLLYPNLVSDKYIDAVKDNLYFEQIENTIRILPLKQPHYFLEYIIKIHETTVPELLARTLDCIRYPFRVRVDFWCIASSSTR